MDVWHACPNAPVFRRRPPTGLTRAPLPWVTPRVVGLASRFGEYTARRNLVMIATLPALVLFTINREKPASDMAASAVKP